MKNPWAIVRRLREEFSSSVTSALPEPTAPTPRLSQGADAPTPQKSSRLDALTAKKERLLARRNQLTAEVEALNTQLKQLEAELEATQAQADESQPIQLRDVTGHSRRWSATVSQRAHRNIPHPRREQLARLREKTSNSSRRWTAGGRLRDHSAAPEKELRTALTRAPHPVVAPKTETPRAEQETSRAQVAMVETVSSTPGTAATSTPQTPVKARLRQVPGIDGLRGIAVAAVVIYHFFGGVLPGGFMGVDMFFILSGFLITSLLVREYAVTGAVSLKNFWLRRVRRILPAAATVLLVCSAIVGMMGGDIAVQLPAQFFSSLFFVNNWVQIAGSSSYFADSGVEVFAHYWSLAVEEQFYLLWPLVFIGLAALGRRWGRGRLPLLVFAVLIGVASATLMGVLFDPQVDPTRVYYGSDTHAFGLLTGVVLALVWGSRSPDAAADSWPVAAWRRSHRFTVATVSTVALVALLAMFVVVTDTAATTYPWALAGAGLLTAVALIGVVAEVGPVSWLAKTVPLRWLGQRSFSLYLWHWPAIIIVEELFRRSPLESVSTNAWVPGLIALVISVPLSAVSYRFVENPFRRHGYAATLSWLVAKRPTFALPRVAIGVATAVAVVLAGVGMVKAPPMTQLEAQLAQAAELQAEANRLAQEAAEAHQREVDSREVPTGAEITAIGDSVLLGAAPALYQQLPGIYVDGEVSRHYTAVPGIVANLEAQDQLRQFVVLSFGTNGQAFEGQMDEILEEIGPDHIVALVSPYGDRYYMQEARDQVRAAVEEYPNVYAADWCARALADPTLVGADGIHPTTTGIDAYIASIMDAFTQWSTDEKVIPAVCGS